MGRAGKLLLLLLCLAAVSCQSGPRSTAAKRRAVPAPPGLEASVVEPRTGEAQERSRLPLDKILAQLPTPEYLAPVDAVAPDAATEPIPLAAQQAYVAGRQAWREGRGRNFEAIRQLQNALVLAPGQPAVLRLLGRIYTASGNPVRGAIYLRQSVAAEPDDLDSVFLLARFAFSQRKWDEAIATLTHALTLSREDADPALPSLLRYFLGSALEREGYDAAAIDQFGRYLDLSEHIDRSTALVRELGLLTRQRGQTWQTVGDLYNRLDQPARALDAYENALTAEAPDATGLMQRLTYTRLRLGKRAAAEATVIDAVRQPAYRAAALLMVPYLQQQGASSAALAAQLQKIHDQSDDSTGLALALANLLEPDQARQLLESHLKANPGDHQVFDAILDRLIPPTPGNGPGSSSDSPTAQKAAQLPSPATVLAAVRTTATAIGADPDSARSYTMSLISRVGDAALVLEAIAGLSVEEKSAPVTQLIRGLCLLQLDRVTEAQAAITTASEAGLVQARLILVNLAIAQRDFENAQALLEPLENRDDPQTMSLRVRVLTELGRAEEALGLLESVLAVRPNDVGLVIDKAMLLLRLGRALEAERVLLDALNAQPQEERLYEALFALYDPPGGQTSPVPDAVRQWQRLMQRVLGAIPNSRLARRKSAEWNLASQEFDAAELTLRSLLAEDAHDAETLDMFLELMDKTNRQEEGNRILEETLAQAPRDRRLLALAVVHYEQRAHDSQRSAQLEEQLVRLDPPSPTRTARLGQVYYRMKDYRRAYDTLLESAGAEDEQVALASLVIIRRCLARLGEPEKFDPLLTRALERFPDRRAQLQMEKVQLLQSTAQRDEAERLLKELLKDDPDDANLNNQLGYTWAERGKNLDEARRMIQKAIDQEPRSAAFVDSMGWVLYKLGRFDEALSWLTRAAREGGGEHPVILNHLGDTQYRLGRRNEAVQSWRAALEKLDPDEAFDDPEQVDMDQRLRAKIDAVNKKTDADVADAPAAPNAPVAAP